MNIWQNTFMLSFGVTSAVTFLYAFWRVYVKQGSYVDTSWPYHFFYTSFVWGDHVIFGAFWTIVSVITLYTNDWILFLLAHSLFRLIRSLGETLYWFLQQFAETKRDPAEKFTLYKIFHNDSVYFVQQIINQCWVVVFSITTLYLAKLWLFQ